MPADELNVRMRQVLELVGLWDRRDKVVSTYSGKSVAKRSMIAGSSMTTKSVADGAPAALRSAPSCWSRWSNSEAETRTTRRSGAITQR